MLICGEGAGRGAVSRAGRSRHPVVGQALQRPRQRRRRRRFACRQPDREDGVRHRAPLRQPPGRWATVAYNAATGAQLWATIYSGDGVFVTGDSENHYATVAYSTATGALWARRYNGPGNGLDQAYSVAVGPSGETVFVTGFSFGATSGADYATLAYSTATGAQLWVSRYNGPGNGSDRAFSVAVNRGGPCSPHERVSQQRDLARKP